MVSAVEFGNRMLRRGVCSRNGDSRWTGQVDDVRGQVDQVVGGNGVNINEKAGD